MFFILTNCTKLLKVIPNVMHDGPPLIRSLSVCRRRYTSSVNPITSYTSGAGTSGVNTSALVTPLTVRLLIDWWSNWAWVWSPFFVLILKSLNTSPKIYSKLINK